MSEIRIAIDAMGGDYAPRYPVEGACIAAQTLGISVVLVGVAEQIRAELARWGGPTDKITVLDTPEWIEMGESPASALRTKKRSSMILAADLVAKGEAQAMISAGNSGAAMGAAVLRMRTLAGVERPAIAIVMPNAAGEMVFLDVGATVDCSPRNLLDFARMGSAYARCRLGRDNPRVGLLSIGEEPSKGNDLTRNAHELLRTDGINFIGNVEPTAMMRGAAEVIVCDGFVGNIALKTMEGFGEFALKLLAEQIAGKSGADADLGAHLEHVKRRLHWAEYGGALLLGVKGLCIISHGRSTPAAITRAIQVGKEAVETQVVASLAQHLAPLASDTPG